MSSLRHSVIAALPTLLCAVLAAPARSAGQADLKEAPLIYGAVYECEAEEINRAMVEVCASQFPDLALQANDALAKWHDRNLVKANSAKEACSRDLKQMAKTASRDDIQAVQKVFVDTKAEIITNFRARTLGEGKTACVDALNQLKTTGGPLDIR